MKAGKACLLIVAYVLVFAVIGTLCCPVETFDGSASFLQQKLMIGGVLGALLGLLAGCVIAGREARQRLKRKL